MFVDWGVGRGVLERPCTAGGWGVPPLPDPLPPPPPPLPMFEADSQSFASAPSVPRGFKTIYDFSKFSARLRRGP